VCVNDLLVDLHRLYCLTFDFVLPFEYVGEDERQVPFFKIGGRYANVELTRGVEFELETKSVDGAKFFNVVICVFGCFVVRLAGDIEKAVHARLDGICALVSEFERTFGKDDVFVDHAVDEVTERVDIVRMAVLSDIKHLL